MKKQMVQALKNHAIANIHLHKTNIDVYFANPAGIGEHSDIMEAIQAEMNTVIDEMAEMESRLLAQQEALEAQQPKLPYASSETTGRKTSNRKTNGTNGANGAARNRTNGASRPEFVEARKKNVERDKPN